MNKKEFLRHELLNILTILGVLLEEANFEEDRPRMKDLVKLAGILINYEDIFLGEEPKFLRQKVPLIDFLEILLSAQEELIQKYKVRIILPLENAAIFIDSSYLYEAFGYLLEKLLPLTTFLEFKFHSAKNQLLLIYNKLGNHEMEKKNFHGILEREYIMNKEIFYQFSLHILKMYCSKIIISSKNIKIYLP